MKRAKETIDRVKKDIRQYWMAGVVFIVYYLIVRAIFDAFCPFLVVTGFPCAGCGLTRAGLHLLRGDISRAAALNPSIFLVALFFLYCGYFRYLKGTKVRGFSLALGALTAVTIVIYLYRMYLYFPDRAPYVYHKKNLLSEIAPWYRQAVDPVLKYFPFNRGEPK